MTTDSVENGAIAVDFGKVTASYQRQISDQSGMIAMKDAIIETQAEQIAHLKQMLDEKVEVAAAAPTARTTPKKRRV